MSAKILIVDDNKLNVKFLTDILVKEGYLVFAAEDGLDIFKTVDDIKPDIILLDIMMPGIDGFDVCSQLKNNMETKNIPVVMVTARTEGLDIKRALELGAFDYIKKTVDDIEVIARVQSALRFKANEDKLRDMAMKDSLTGLYNHALLIELFEKEIQKHIRTKKSMAFAMADIDYFKMINDTYGHLSGDTILKETAEILQNNIRKSDIAGRYGGEEFSLVFPETNCWDALRICERIRSEIENHIFKVNEKEIKITISIGISYYDDGSGLNYQDIIRNSDKALYLAKENGRNKIEVYSSK